MKRAVLWLAVSTRAQAEDEKTSLPTQEADGRAEAEKRGWQVVDVLRVPGHSRSFFDFNKLADAAWNSKLRIDAFHKLREHWEKADFDILWARDGDRFARSQSLFARIVEEIVISANAAIWSASDGLVDKSNFRMWISMVGYRAAGDIDRLKKYRHDAMNENARRGLPTSSIVLWTHKVVRDEMGKAVAVVPDPDKKRIVEDMARLIVEGHGWIDISQMLYERFGHVDANGKPFPRGWAYNLVHNPLFWGHSARYHHEGGTNGHRTDMWVFDESEPVPEGVMMFRNTVAPALTGELADMLKTELRRRRYVIRGKARPLRTRRFSGLFLCKTCGYSLVYRFNKGYPGYACQSKYWPTQYRMACPEDKHLMEWKIQAYLDPLLRLAVASGDLETLIGEEGNDTEVQQRAAALEADILALEEQARRCIQKQLHAPANLAHLYDEELERIGERLANVRATLLRLRQQTQSQSVRQARERALQTLSEMGVDAFWSLPATEINQLLHTLMGSRRFVIEHGEFVGLDDMPVRKRGRSAR